MKFIVPIKLYSTRNRKFQKKKAKKVKKLLDTIRTSLQAETGRERPRKREIKNYRFVQFLPDWL